MAWVPRIATKDGVSLMVLRAQVLVQILANRSVTCQQVLPLNRVNSPARGLNNQPPNHDFVPPIPITDLIVCVPYWQKQIQSSGDWSKGFHGYVEELERWFQHQEFLLKSLGKPSAEEFADRLLAMFS